MSAPDPAMHRSDAQVQQEQAMAEVSDVLLNLEHGIERARKALKKVQKIGTEGNVELALSDTVRDLDKVRKRLVQDTYYASDNLRLI